MEKTMLRAEHLRVARLATKEESRYSLSAIRVTPDTVEVTDGHLLLLAEHEPIDPATLPVIEGVTPGNVESFCLSQSDALAILRAIPKKKRFEDAAIPQIGTESNANGCAIIGISDGSSTQVFKPRKAEGLFPNIQTCIPRTVDRPVSITFDPTLMVALCTQIADLTKGTGRIQAVTMRISDEKSSIRFDATTEHGEAVVAILMPLSPSEATCHSQYPKL